MTVFKVRFYVRVQKDTKQFKYAKQRIFKMSALNILSL